MLAQLIAVLLKLGTVKPHKLIAKDRYDYQGEVLICFNEVVVVKNVPVPVLVKQNMLQAGLLHLPVPLHAWGQLLPLLRRYLKIVRF
jgi:hypothetical protein